MEWLPRRIDPTAAQFNVLTAGGRDAIIALNLDEHLPALGLTAVNPRTWADHSRSPAKRVFELMLLKGAGMRARWGFSLGFVPHISGGRIRWHRSERAVVLDVIIEPTKGVLPEPTYIYGAARLHDDLRSLLTTAVERAKEAWRHGETERGMLELVREIRELHTNYFRFEMYTQLPLAYSFLSARLGDIASAESELDRYASRLKLDDDVAAKLKELARPYASLKPS
jgi:hypothetical protein